MRIRFSISCSENTFVRLLVRMHSCKEPRICVAIFSIYIVIVGCGFCLNVKSNILGFPAGLCPIVGVGGHISGGGYGSLLQRYCLMVDNVLDAQIIDVNSQVLDRKAMGEDLFGAIRGGGSASFGVVLAYRIRLVRVPEIHTVFNVQKTEAENATDVLYKWQNIADKIDNDLFISVIVQPITGKVKGQKIIRLTFMGHFLGDANRLISVMNTGFP